MTAFVNCQVLARRSIQGTSARRPPAARSRRFPRMQLFSLVEALEVNAAIPHANFRTRCWQHIISSMRSTRWAILQNTRDTSRTTVRKSPSSTRQVEKALKVCQDGLVQSERCLSVPSVPVHLQGSRRRKDILHDVGLQHRSCPDYTSVQMQRLFEGDVTHH
jgi:hypothetical protein